jgi:protein pelota
MKNSKLSVVSSIIDKIFECIHRNDFRFAIGIGEIRIAADTGAIDSLIYSDAVFSVIEEGELISLLNLIEYSGSKIYGVDATTDIGLRITSLGGAVALLRYQIPLSRG